MILGYWKIKARGEPLRILMHYLNIEFEERNFSINEWFLNKDKMGFDFPNLPFLIDGEKKLTESQTIILYLCRKKGRLDLLGNGEKEKLKHSMIYSVLNDIYERVYIICNTSDYRKKF